MNETELAKQNTAKEGRKNANEKSFTEAFRSVLNATAVSVSIDSNACHNHSSRNRPIGNVQTKGTSMQDELEADKTAVIGFTMGTLGLAKDVPDVLEEQAENDSMEISNEIIVSVPR